VAPVGQPPADPAPFTPQVGSEITLPNVAFNPLMAIPQTPEEIERERIIENIAVLDLGLDATDGEYAEYAKMFEDASINVLMEAQGNREREAVLMHSPDSGYEIDYRQPVGERMKMLDLTQEDIRAIGAELGLEGQGITEFKMTQKTQEIMEQNRLISEVEMEFEKLNMLDLPAAIQTIEAQKKLLNDLVDEYEELYKQYEEYDNE
jgi:hypothetical protein